MKSKYTSSIRWKIILMFVASIILSVLSVLLMITIAYNLAMNNRILYYLLQTLRDVFGVLAPGIAVGIILFIVFFFLLSRHIISYLEQISEAVQEISLGKMDIELPVKTSDELGELAMNINTMTAQLKQSIEEERNAEKSKNELVTSVSHDLRTPLTSILGYLQLIDDDRYRDEVELRYYVNIAYEKAQHLKKLIDDLFDYTRVSYGGLKLSPSRIDLRELLIQLAEEFVPVLNSAGMEYRLLIPEESYIVQADGDLMVRVFENLISNAVRYGREGKYVDIELEKEYPWIIARIVNYGETIPQSELPYIFERFYRVEKSRSKQTGGTGLGLAITKNIVELHEGKISAYSHRERTVFEVKIKSQS